MWGTYDASPGVPTGEDGSNHKHGRCRLVQEQLSVCSWIPGRVMKATYVWLPLRTLLMIGSGNLSGHTCANGGRRTVVTQTPYQIYSMQGSAARSFNSNDVIDTSVGPVLAYLTVRVYGRY